MGFWGTLGKIAGVAGAGLGTALSFGAAAPALGAALGSVGLGGATGGALAGGLSAAGSALGAKSQADASNRGTQFEGQLELQRLLMERDKQNQDMQIEREQENRAGQGSAFARLLAAQHVLNPAQRTPLSPYSSPRRMPSEAEQTGADALTREVLARLQGGNPIAPVSQTPLSVDPSLLKAGKGESITGWLSALLPSAGLATGIFNKQPPVMSGIPTGNPRA